MLRRVLVVDNEEHAVEDLGDLLALSERVGEVDTADSATEALLKLRTRSYDAVFVDIRMPGLDGLELAGILGRFADPPPVVFVTAYHDHAVEAFALEATDYLLKPVNEDRLSNSLSRLEDRLGRGAPIANAPTVEEDRSGDELPFVGVEVNGRTVLIERGEIRFVEAQGDYVRLHTHHDAYLIRRSISSLAARWAPHGFVRIHRSYLVNLRHVIEISPFFNQALVVRLDDKDQTRLQVSRRRAGDLRDRLGLAGSGR
jgi:DNA-binding LytR/AlgR family response regulator